MSPLIQRDDGGGPRHFVDDKPVHCVSFLELQLALNGQTTAWLEVRYEANIHDGHIDATLHVPWGVIHPRYSKCTFRWPERRGA